MILQAFQCKFLFGRNKIYQEDWESSNYVFKTLFPSIFNFVVNYKAAANDGKGNHRVLSHKLQESESNFIFNGFLLFFLFFKNF